MKIYVTKYALTKGIYTAEADVNDRGFAVVKGARFHLDTYLHGEGREWCRTEADAISVAEKMRDKAIKDAERKIAKLKAMTFDVVGE